MFKTTLFIVLIILFASPAYSDEASHRKLAIQLVRIHEDDIDNNYSIEREVDNILRNDPSLKPYRQIFIKFMSKYLSNKQLKKYLVIAFMNEFPEKEMAEIVAFLSSPAGKIWTKKSRRFDLIIESVIKNVFMQNEGELRKMVGNG